MITTRDRTMKATILLGTLKREDVSSTATLCEFLVERMERAGIESETVKLIDYDIPPVLNCQL